MNPPIWDTFQKARKEYSCDSCGKKIVPGHRYRRTFFNDSHNGPYVWREHDECFRVCQLIFTEHKLNDDEWPQIAELENEDILFAASEDPGAALFIWGDLRLEEISKGYDA